MYRDLPPLTWLRAFEVSARLLSFTAAAQELHLTQAAVSKHVKSLELRLQRDVPFGHTVAVVKHQRHRVGVSVEGGEPLPVGQLQLA